MSSAARWLIVAGCAASLAVPVMDVARGSADDAFGFFVGAVREASAEDGWLAANRFLLARIDELEESLESDSTLLRLALPTVQQWLSKWGGAGNEKVYLGRDDWLFLRPGIDYLTGPPFLDPRVLERRALSGESWEEPPQADPLAAILDFHRQLKPRGIRLLVLPAPTKAMIYPEKLSASVTDPEDAVFHNSSFVVLRAELEEHGIEVFDPAAVLLEAKLAGDEDVFLHTDSHWSPAGLEAVAAALGARLRELGYGSETPSSARRAVVVHRGDGDLERMLELPESSPWPPPERVRLRRVVGLPGGPAEILLLGDSFSNVFSQDHLGWGMGAGLAEQLAFELGEPVDRLARDAGGAWNSRQKLADDPGRLAGKRLVIYQFAVRELAVGDWKMIELNPSPPWPPSPAHASHPPGRGGDLLSPIEAEGRAVAPLSRVEVKRGLGGPGRKTGRG